MTFNREDLELLLPQPKEQKDGWSWATVTQESPLRIRLDGDDAALLITPESLVGEQAVGRRVWVQLVGRRAIVHGVQFGPEPPGTLRPLAHGSVPPGWLLCDGAAISRTTYAALFAKIGTTWGPGNGATTFNLPDGRDRSLIGASGTRALGTTGGEAAHTLTVAEMPSHQHNHNQADGGNLGYGGDGSTVAYTAGFGNSRLNTNIATGFTGGGQAHNNMPPYFVGNWIIRV